MNKNTERLYAKLTGPTKGLKLRINNRLHYYVHRTYCLILGFKIFRIMRIKKLMMSVSSWYPNYKHICNIIYDLSMRMAVGDALHEQVDLKTKPIIWLRASAFKLLNEHQIMFKVFCIDAFMTQFLTYCMENAKEPEIASKYAKFYGQHKTVMAEVTAKKIKPDELAWAKTVLTKATKHMSEKEPQ